MVKPTEIASRPYRWRTSWPTFHSPRAPICVARASPRWELWAQTTMRAGRPRLLLTGMSGTGKSTALRGLAAHGVVVVDADSDAWSSWQAGPDGGLRNVLLRVRGPGAALVLGLEVGAHRFVDIAFRSLVSDPIGEVKRIYEAAGLTLDGAAERRMREFVAGEKPRQGRHSYAATDFNLDPDELRERFSFYYEHFGVPPEG